MDTIHHFLQYLSSQNGAFTFAAIAALIICYFLLKNLIKMAIIFALVLLVFGGYLYVKNPQKMSESVKQTVMEARTKTGKVIQTSKNAYRDAKDLVDKGKGLPGEIDQFITEKKKAKQKEREKQTQD
jgi:hypothetical protein